MNLIPINREIDQIKGRLRLLEIMQCVIDTRRRNLQDLHKQFQESERARSHLSSVLGLAPRRALTASSNF
jgi:hypothetical protein